MLDFPRCLANGVACNTATIDDTCIGMCATGCCRPSLGGACGPCNDVPCPACATPAPTAGDPNSCAGGAANALVYSLDGQGWSDVCCRLPDPPALPPPSRHLAAAAAVGAAAVGATTLCAGRLRHARRRGHARQAHRRLDPARPERCRRHQQLPPPDKGRQAAILGPSATPAARRAQGRVHWRRGRVRRRVQQVLPGAERALAHLHRHQQRGELPNPQGAGGPGLVQAPVRKRRWLLRPSLAAAALAAAALAAGAAVAARAAVRHRLAHRRERRRLRPQHRHEHAARLAHHGGQPGQQLLQALGRGAGARRRLARRPALLQRGRRGQRARRALLRARGHARRRRHRRAQHRGQRGRVGRRHADARRVHRRGARALRLPRHVRERARVLRHHAAVRPVGHAVPVPHVRRLPRVHARVGHVRPRPARAPRVPRRGQPAPGRHARVLPARGAPERAARRAARSAARRPPAAPVAPAAPAALSARRARGAAARAAALAMGPWGRRRGLQHRVRRQGHAVQQPGDDLAARRGRLDGRRAGAAGGARARGGRRRHLRELHLEHALVESGRARAGSRRHQHALLPPTRRGRGRPPRGQLRRAAGVHVPPLLPMRRGRAALAAAARAAAARAAALPHLLGRHRLLCRARIQAERAERRAVRVPARRRRRRGGRPRALRAARRVHRQRQRVARPLRDRLPVRRLRERGGRLRRLRAHGGGLGAAVHHH